jgi:hypothetical protein
MIIPAMAAALFLASPGTSTISMSCAVAAHVAIRQAVEDTNNTESPGGPQMLLRRYSNMICVESRKVNGRIFVIFAPGGLVRDGGLEYVVEPNLEARRVRGIPCEDSPEPTVCE